MKRIRIYAILLAVAIIAGVSIFYACEKEEVKTEKNEKVNNTDLIDNADPEKDWEAHIDELIASTGIDIYALSELEEVRKVADQQMRIMSVATTTTHAKGALTEAKLIQIQNLGRAIDAANAQGNEYEVLRLFDSLCAICRTIDGFVFNVNEYGLQTFTFDIDKEPLQLPIINMQAEVATAIAVIEAIETATPQITTLPFPVRTEVVAAALSVSIQHSIMPTKGYSVTDCQKEARLQYAISAGSATALYEVALVSCAFSGPAAPGCIAVASASYGVAMAIATWQYKRALNRCN